MQALLYFPVTIQDIVDCSYVEGGPMPKAIDSRVEDYPLQCALADDFNYISLKDRTQSTVLKVAINPNIQDYDAEEELRMWIHDSMEVVNNKKLDNKTALSLLPVKNMKLCLKEGTLNLNNCRLVKRESGAMSSIVLTLIISNITK